MNLIPKCEPRPDSELSDLVRSFDESDHLGRVRRLRLIDQEFGYQTEFGLVGGIPAVFALTELQRSFVFGNYFATVLVAQSFIELSLGAALAMAGKDEEAQSSYIKLVQFAIESGIVAPDLGARIKELRHLRNPYAHYRHINHRKGYVNRFLASGSSPEVLLEADAVRALRLVAELLRTGSPNWIAT